MERVDAAPTTSRSRAPLASISVSVDFGKDRGQNLGSLFEARDSQGRAFLGAGFVGVYNTLFRTDRHTLQFYFRPGEGGDQFSIEPLPRPSEDAGAYLFDLDGALYAWGYVHDLAVRRWQGDRWEVDASFDRERIRLGDVRMRVGKGLLELAQSTIRYEGKVVVPPPEEGAYHHLYYANGHLVFYHTEPERGRLLAVPWTPGDEAAADLARASVLTLKYARETTFSLGQLGREVLTCSNLGGLYAFAGTEWRILRAPDDRVSYQIYSMLNYYDRLLMAHYPSGTLYEYDGRQVRPLEGWPPVPPGVSASVREAQTTTIYRGELFVGVWPWGELWRYDRDANRWIAMGRLFRHPPLTDRVAHPYEQEIIDYNAANGTSLVHNDWGQRVTGMIPREDGLILATSAKGPWQRDARLGFLTDEVYAQYGAVHRLRLPGNLAVTIRRTDGPTRLRFVLERNRMAVFQDGRLLGETALDPKLTAGLPKGHISWGQGIFGPLQGQLRSQTARWSSPP
ncbi:MAG: hypothetical protein GX774_16110 [Armatimonadetes bacterium]|nr:hypothetical protein [Armatimonadota bacterium]